MNKDRKRPEPVVDARELKLLDELTERYEKMIRPGYVAKLGGKLSELLPACLKDGLKDLGGNLTEQELFKKMMSVVESGFSELQSQAVKITISEKQILSLLGKQSPENAPTEMEEICLMRSYKIARAVNVQRSVNIAAAAVEGGATGAFGFPGLPFNLVLSLFLYFRAVQSIAMFYGYDVKNDNAEMVIAGEVFTKGLNPFGDDSGDETMTLITKIMVMSEATMIKETSRKTWSDMIAKGGVPLVLTQIRALANKAAARALENAGKKGLEHSVFQRALTLLGKRLTLKSIGKAVPIASAVLGAMMDSNQMGKLLDYADVFYHKRFLLEKNDRERILFSQSGDMIVEQNSEACADAMPG